MTASDLRAPLHLHRVTGSAEPTRWIVFLHGILGSGANWAGFARRLVEARPDFGACLVDLRLHGRSGAGHPPHTVEAAAADVVASLAKEGIAPAVVSGHSFGSKVAFRVAASLDPTPDSVWLLDADPGARPGAQGRSLVLRVLEALRTLPKEYDSREDFTTALTERGFPASLAGWLGKNLVRAAGTLHLQLDLDAIEAILEDYHGTDLWSELATSPAAVHAVIGGRSDVFAEGARERLAEAHARGDLTLSELPEAGHWVHIDAPKGLLEAFLRGLPPVSG